MAEKANAFIYEFAFYNFIAALIEYLGTVLERLEWTMSPSRFYTLIADTIEWCRSKDLWHFGQPAFLYVIEQCRKRAEKLEGTHDDESRVMEMTTWEYRKSPVPGGDLSILQIFDWFLPILRMAEARMFEYFGNPDQTANGKEFTEYEAWNLTMLIVDKLYKDPHFGEVNAWGWHKAYPWVDFVRDEMYEWSHVLKPNAPTPPAGYDPPFSTP